MRDFEIRGNKQCRKVEGYAAVFDSPSKVFGGEWDEVLDRGAITQDTIDKSIVLALLNHDDGRGALARSKYGKGSLKLSVDSHGLKFEFEAPNTTTGDELLESIKRGDIDSCSFAFTVAEERWDKVNGIYRRTILRIGELFDVSPVYNEAYPEAQLTSRSKRIDYEKYKKQFQ